MFAEVHLARLKQAFAAQFTPERDGYLYRRGQRGPGIRVTCAERDRFVATFDRAIVRWAWGMVLATIVTLGGLALLPVALPPPFNGYEESIAIALLLVCFMSMWWWIRAAPARALERRVQIDQGVSGADFRRASLVAMPWSLPVVAALFQIALVVRVACFEPDPWARQQWGYYMVAAVGLTGMAAISWLKWRARR